MNEQQLAAVKQALEALEGVVKNCWRDIPSWRLDEIKERIAALQSIISQDALYKMAEESRTSGLRLDDWDKIGCVNHDCDKCKAVQEPVGEVSGHDWSTGLLYRDLEPGTPLYTTPPAAQPAPVQEPVAIVVAAEYEDGSTAGHRLEWRGRNEANDFPEGTEFYTTPQPLPVKTYHDGKPWPVQPKPWVGLTDADVYAVYMTVQPAIANETVNRIAYNIEAKLKEKNT